MKVEDAIAQRKRPAPSVKERVLSYIAAHPDEVFTYRDEELQKAVGSTRAGLGFALWSLHKDGAIDKYEDGGRAFFGSAGAIAEMKARVEGDDPWERARQNADRIYKKYGPINALELLDEVRGGWD